MESSKLSNYCTSIWRELMCRDSHAGYVQEAVAHWPWLCETNQVPLFSIRIDQNATESGQIGETDNIVQGTGKKVRYKATLALE